MENRDGLLHANGRHSTTIWTANKNNLSFPELRGDNQNSTTSQLTASNLAILKSAATTKLLRLNGLLLQRQNAKPKECLGSSAINMQNVYVVALSAEVYGLLSWLANTTEQLTKVGTCLQHIEDHKRITKRLAMTMLMISQSDFEKRRKFYRNLLYEARHYLEQSQRTAEDNSTIEQKKVEYRAGEYETLHHKGVRSSLNNLNRRRGLCENTEERKCSSVVSSFDCCHLSFTDNHLKRVEKLWKLLRVQLQVLRIQLISPKVSTACVGQYADEVASQARKATTAPSLSADQIHQFGFDRTRDCIKRFASRSSLFEMPNDDLKDSSVADSCDSGFERGTNSWMDTRSESTIRDDGYLSKSIGSEVACANNYDECETVPLELKVLLQELGYKTRCLDVENKTKRGDTFVSQTAASKESERGEEVFDDDPKWAAICDTVERFSQNTLSLLSWVEELQDVATSDENKEKTYFYKSKDERLKQVTAHARRLYELVIADAETLSDQLPSERDTIQSVMDKVQADCAGLDIFDGHLLPTRTAASRATNAQPPDVVRATTKSTPARRNMLKYDTSTPRTSQRDATQAQDRDFCAVRPQLGSLALSSRRSWYDFIDEYNRILAWICKMERFADGGDYGGFTRSELLVLYETQLDEIAAHMPKRDRLAGKAEVLDKLHPELRYDANMRYAEIEMLWEQLESKLRIKLTASPRTVVSPRQTMAFTDRSGRLFDAVSFPSEEYTTLRSKTPDAKVPLEDHSFRQIRDQLSFENNESPQTSLPRNIQASSELDSKLSSRWAYSIATGSDSESRPSMAENVYPASANGNQVQPITKKNQYVGSVTPKEEYNHPAEYNDDQLQREIELVDWELELSDIDLGENDEPTSPHQSADTLFTNPFLLARRVMSFCKWLSKEESGVLLVANKIGWFPSQLKQTWYNNKNQQKRLATKRSDLNQILSAANTITKENEIQGCAIDIPSLQWSCLMLQQRYLALSLTCTDLDCVLERRIDVLSKDCDVTQVIAHPLEGLWSDRGETDAISLEFSESDYNILYSSV